jgi:hypothetical protein
MNQTSQTITVTLSEASRIIGLTTATLRRMCEEGRLKHSRLHNGVSQRTTFLIHKDALEAILQPYEPPVLPVRPRKQVGRPRTVMV